MALAARRRLVQKWAAAVCLLLIVLPACAFTDLTAPTDASISISANPPAIGLNGAASVITVILSNADGSPVPNDTQVFLTTTLGEVPQQVGTVSGVAKARLVSHDVAGTALVAARSGAADVSAEIEIFIGAVPATLIVSADPTTLLADGGTAKIRALVFGDDGAVLEGVDLVFSTTAGSLASGGAPRTTNAQGVATDELTTSEPATVTVQSRDLTASVTVSLAANERPSAQFSFDPSSPDVGEVVRFDASASRDPDGQIVEYRWNWGDRTSPTISASPVADHVFEEEGNFTVTLTVTDDQGDTATATTSVGLSNDPPDASFTFSPDRPSAGDTVTFDASSSTDRDGHIVRYEWRWGDGSSPTVTSSPLTTHVFADPGTYAVTLTVTDNLDAESVTSFAVTVQ